MYNNQFTLSIACLLTYLTTFKSIMIWLNFLVSFFWFQIL